MMKDIPVRYLDGVGWVAEVEMYMNPFQLKKTAALAHKQLYSRLLDLPFGEKKERIKTLLEDLKMGKIKQVPIKKEGGFELFQSTAKMTDTIYSYSK